MQFNYLKYDLYRYFFPNDDIVKCSLLQKIQIVIFTQGIWVIILYRIRKWLWYENNNAILRLIVKFPLSMFHLVISTFTGIHIMVEADIGPGLYIGHFGGIIIGPAKIGKFCNISQGVTIGVAGRDQKYLPSIGDFNYIGPGAVIIGNSKTGNNVAIGANAVVTKDLPENAVAVGVPAKVISYRSSNEYVHYNKQKCNSIIDKESVSF